jgi:hypothetical protein
VDTACPAYAGGFAILLEVTILMRRPCRNARGRFARNLAPASCRVCGRRAMTCVEILYVLNRDSGRVSAFTIGGDGTLSLRQNLEDILPATTFANGLMAR